MSEEPTNDRNDDIRQNISRVINNSENSLDEVGDKPRSCSHYMP
ncbi:hypothetical protein [Candidatus Nitrosocosmicus arcticus]|uniref:Uncharacterized protein n=1 Tax=Candidatus Nitrosocosmicus arcticus TaxID=2035267 RepID=A0A557SWN3_9ARCH|nr:hypothetical protein [Candidatus Nitrosocosmicus arcticus]TVP41027.1 hypothetical protein NARC_50208 [Candidatus Nitrosocosmicus arcticus]